MCKGNGIVIDRIGQITAYKISVVGAELDELSRAHATSDKDQRGDKKRDLKIPLIYSTSSEPDNSDRSAFSINVHCQNVRPDTKYVCT